MKDINILREKINCCDGNLKGKKFEDIVAIFINSLYKGVEGESYSIRAITPEDINFKSFIEINKKLIYKYSNNIKKDYDNKLLDSENEYSNIYLYIIESLYLFFKNHCNEDIELFKSYIEDSNKTYVNSEDKEYTFDKYMYMSVKRMIIEENKLYEKSLEKGCMNESDRFARIDLDVTLKTEEGSEKEIDLYSVGLFRLLEDEDTRSEEQILKDNVREMTRIQDRLLTVLTRSQMEFVTTQTYGCYYEKDIKDFVIKEYTRQQKNQFFNQISKRINRDIKPFFIKKHNEKYVDEMIKYRKKNKRKLDATSRDLTEYINKESSFKVSNIKINKKISEN